MATYQNYESVPWRIYLDRILFDDCCNTSLLNLVPIGSCKKLGNVNVSESPMFICDDRHILRVSFENGIVTLKFMKSLNYVSVKSDRYIPMLCSIPGFDSNLFRLKIIKKTEDMTKMILSRAQYSERLVDIEVTRACKRILEC